MSTLKINNKSPLYLQIAYKLEEKIKSESYHYGEKLPSENQLAIKYKVSRVTIREALNILEKKHFIERKKGSGNYVIYNSFKNLFLARSANIISFSEDLKNKNITPKNEVVFFELIDPPAEIIKILKLNDNQKVYHFQRIRYGNNNPYSIETTYLTSDYFDNLSIKTLKGSKLKYYEDYTHMKIALSYQRVKAIQADEKIKNVFNIQIGTPILLMQHTTYFDNGTPFDYTEIVLNPKFNDVEYIKINRL